jgi:hypothetical protein
MKLVRDPPERVRPGDLSGEEATSCINNVDVGQSREQPGNKPDSERTIVTPATVSGEAGRKSKCRQTMAKKHILYIRL